MSSLYQSKWATPEPKPPKPLAAPTAPVVLEQQQPAQESKPEPVHEPAPTIASPSSPRPTSSSALSAAATTFSPLPSAPPPDVSTYDAFAQTGTQQDDLFDDVVPVEESMQTRPPDDLFGDDFTPEVAGPVIVEQPAAAPVVQEPEMPSAQQGHGRGRGREDGGGRGRGKGRGRGGQNGRGAPQERERLPPQEREQKNGDEVASHAPATAQRAPEQAPTGPRKEPTTSAVRGDRFATGGIRKPKLTEQELTEKLARIQLKNASLTAAHERAEADAASFAQREEAAKTVANKKAKEERRDRQQLMGERERNRMRKLKAMDGREWDQEKNEEDFSRGGRFDKKGGFAGDQGDYSDGREYLYREPRGGRGGGAGRGGGRGGRETKESVPKQEDFPALPLGSAGDEKKADTSLTDGSQVGKSWADQVESSASTG